MNQAPPNIQFGAAEMALMGIGGILVLAAVVCSVIVAVRMIKEEQTALGIISIILTFCTGIGFVITLIFGWIKSAEWNIKGLMIGYTAAFLLGYGMMFTGYGIFVAKLVNEVQNNPQFQQQMQQLEQELEGLEDGIEIEIEEPAQ